MDSAKLRNRAIGTVSILLGLAFLFAGAVKIINGSTPVGNWDDQFVKWGYPAWARWIVGLTELGGAIALLIPRTRFYGVAVLVPTMAGAVLTQIANQEPLGGIVPAILGVLAGIVAWTTRPAWLQTWMQNRLGFPEAA
jgi:uncharacterized membrane protein YphA (DoxX/SURF4 family)